MELVLDLGGEARLESPTRRPLISTLLVYNVVLLLLVAIVIEGRVFDTCWETLRLLPATTAITFSIILFQPLDHWVIQVCRERLQ